MSLRKNKKNKKPTSFVKQKKKVTARLMAISLKADDYIYNNKQISKQEAEKYAKELESFKNQCHDERYLQVIEKLTSYMEIISREQSAQEINEANILPTAKSVEELNEHIQTAGPEYNAVDTMERSISNLCIDPKDIVKPSTDITNDDNTQIITEIEYCTSTTISNEFNKITNDSIATNNIANNKINTINNSNNSEEVSNPKTKQQYKKEIVANNNKSSQNILSDYEYRNYMELDISGHHTNNEQQTILEPLKNVEINSNKLYEQNVPSNLSQIPNNIIAEDHKRKRILPKKYITNYITTVPKKAKIKTSNKTKTVKALINSTHTNVRKEGNLNPTIQTTTNVLESVDNSVPNKNRSKSSLKKKSQDIDLSWVENIKFLRVIDTEEYNKFDNLEESFWSNLSLPSNFDPNDFEYDNINIWKI